MLNQYQTGPLATACLFAAILGLIVADLVFAIHFHHRWAWLSAASLVLLLFIFHRLLRTDTK